MKTSTYKFPKVLKKTKKAGQRDGKNEVPKNDWNKGSVPYLNLLHKQYVDRQQTKILGFKKSLSQLESSKVNAEQHLIEASNSLDLAQKRYEEAHVNVQKVENEINGELEDMPSSLPAKRRNLGTVPYVIILTICTIAELMVTIPALQFLLGEKKQFAALLAFALGTATFFGAHFLGTTLKRRQDRSVPQPRIDLALVAGMTVVLFFAVIFLAYVRANQTLPFAGNFVELPEQWKLEVLWTIWAVWQITFFCIASVASFKHHSEAVSRLNRAKQIRFFRKRQLERAKSVYSKAHTQLEGMNVDWKPSLEKSLDQLKQEERQLLAQYSQACALYIDSNIHARRQSIKGDHPAFESHEIVLTDIDFLSLAPSDNSKTWDISGLEAVGSNK
ncbi:MAG: hypothetical protein ACKOFA_00010 [Rhodoluna sp.]